MYNDDEDCTYIGDGLYYDNQNKCYKWGYDWDYTGSSNNNANNNAEEKNESDITWKIFLLLLALDFLRPAIPTVIEILRDTFLG